MAFESDKFTVTLTGEQWIALLAMSLAKPQHSIDAAAFRNAFIGVGAALDALRPSATLSRLAAHGLAATAFALVNPPRRPGDHAAIYAAENGVDYATALVKCNMD